MATGIVSDVFRFVALRPPTPIADDDPVAAPVKDERDLGDTIVGQVIKGMGRQRSQGRLLSQLKVVAELKDIGPTLPTDGPAAVMSSLVRVIRMHRADFDTKTFASDVAAALGQSIPDFVNGNDWGPIRDQLWDRLEVHYLLNRDAAHSLEDLVDGLRALRLMQLIANGLEIASTEHLARAGGATLVLPSSSITADVEPVERSPRESAQAENDTKKRHSYRRLWDNFVKLNQALEQVEHAPLEAVTKTDQRKAPPPETAPDDPDGPRRGAERDRPPTGTRVRLITESSTRLMLGKKLIASLPDMARGIVERAQVDDTLSDKPAVLDALRGKLAQASDQILSAGDPLLLEEMPEEAAELPGMYALRKQFAVQAGIETVGPTTIEQFPWVVRPTIRPLGIGDLKVVKETLLRYVAGEVAHIENVLKGESKERRHRRLDRTEETFTVEAETIEETERDSQTTDRFELKKETEKTIQSDMSIDAGVTVSASYGPVELGAYANFAYGQSSSDTTRTSTNFARDVVDRSLTKIQKRAREERISKILNEIEETNIHGLTNVDGEEHISGIYRWVDKHYEAQVYNYGRRMMFEFVVPEPAAYYYYSQDNDPANTIDVKKPRELGFLRHTDIQDWNFGTYIRAYNVQGVAPPPPAWKVVSFALDQNGMTDDQAISKSTRELLVPDGYVARSWGHLWRAWMGSNSYFQLLVGLNVNGGSAALDNEDSIVPIGVVANDVFAFAATVEVFCERTRRAYETWQIATFEKIVAAYEAATAAYEDRLRAAEARRGIVIEGRNPGLNRIIVRNELKKHSLSLLTGQDYSTFDAVSGTPPVMDLFEAVDEGEFAQFFEQAFEWEQMTYLFYPYFWSRPSTWNKRINFNDPDPHFNQFLQAGSVRVVIPVHPAYNDAILHYVETGAIWNGGEPPHIDDPMFISIVEELKAATDNLGGAEPEGDPWQVVVPTSLVHLQAEPTLPDYTT